jgi:FkbM family methyltransferase
MKHLITFLLLLFFHGESLPFNILPQIQETSSLGYGDWYIHTDGELTLIKHFLKPGNVVFDVGGHLGEWSMYALQTEPTIQLFSFEPVPAAFEQLSRSLKDRSRTFNLAFSNKKGHSPFFHYAATLSESGLSGFFYREVLRGDHQEPLIIMVPHTTLDNFCEEHAISHIDLIKIDTEGSELAILQGAAKLLADHRIKIIQFEYGGCYVDAHTKLKDVIRLLTDNNYVVFRIFQDGLIHISKWEASLENFNLSNYCAIAAEEMADYSPVLFND